MSELEFIELWNECFGAGTTPLSSATVIHFVQWYSESLLATEKEAMQKAESENAELTRKIDELSASMKASDEFAIERENAIEELNKILSEARSVPEGWKLVPEESVTDNMKDAGADSLIQSHKAGNGVTSSAVFCYHAMLAASTKPEGAD